VPLAPDAGRPPATVLVRIVPSGAGWTGGLPPVPPGRVVTVSVNAPDLLPDRTRLEARGYTFAGLRPAPLVSPGARVADVLVPVDVAEAEPRWWGELVLLADRVFHLALGPVRQAFRSVAGLPQATAR
jgi:hypothetical protein